MTFPGKINVPAARADILTCSISTANSLCFLPLYSRNRWGRVWYSGLYPTSHDVLCELRDIFSELPRYAKQTHILQFQVGTLLQVSMVILRDSPLSLSVRIW